LRLIDLQNSIGDKTGSGFKQLIKNRADGTETALLLLKVILKKKVAYCPFRGWEDIIDEVS
jgi:hypothetical protein